jgi:hypothetical protein
MEVYCDEVCRGGLDGGLSWCLGEVFLVTHECISALSIHCPFAGISSPCVMPDVCVLHVLNLRFIVEGIETISKQC